MMTNTDLENLYKINVSESHAAGLRGVFDAGYNLALGLTQATATDAANNASAVTSLNDVPIITTA
jgi:hypothetical protein